MPGIIGYNTIGGLSDAADPGWSCSGWITSSGKTYTAVAGDVVTEVAVYGDGTGDCRLGIYTVNSGTGRPDTLVAGSITDIAVGASAGWHTASCSVPLTDGVEYTVCIDFVVTESWNMRYDLPGGTQQSSGPNGGNQVLPDPTWVHNGDDSGAVSFFATVEAGGSVEQEGYRFRNDDGDEDGATWLAAADTPATVALDTNTRLRVLLNGTDDPGSTQYRLEWTEDGTSNWRAIGEVAPTFIEAGALTAQASGTTITTTIPGSATTNDIMVLALMCNGSTTFSQPTDWNLLGTSVESNANQSTEWYWKRHDGSESNPVSTTSATLSGTVGGYGRIYVIRGCITTGDPFEDVTMAGSPTTDNNPDTAEIDTTGTNRLVMSFLMVDDDNTWSSGNPPANWSAAGTRVSSTTGGDAMMDAIQRTVTSATTVTAATIGTMNAADYWRSLTLAFIPAVPKVDYATSSNFADGDATTAQLTAPSGKTTGDFDAGVMVEGQALADAVDVTTDGYTELEWVLQVQSPAAASDVIDFRVTANGTALDTYAVTPTLTVSSGATDLTVQGATHSHTAGSPTLTQTHVLSVNAATHTQTADNVTLSTATNLTVQNAEHGHAAASPTLTQVHVLTVQGATHTHTAASPTLTQLHILSVNASTHGHAAGSPTLTLGVEVLYPASISGRKLLDQNGDVYLAKVFSSWKLANKLNNADITEALEGVAANGFNGVTVWCGGIEDRFGEGDQYENQAGHPFWATTAGGTTPDTPWAMNNGTELGAAWSSVDWIVSECARLGMVLHFSFCAGYDAEGAGPDWEAATNTDMYNVGVALATRYAAATNIVWHIMFDFSTSTGSTRGQRIQALFDGINDTEGPGTRPVRWCENDNGVSTSSAGWYQAGNFNATINCIYSYNSNSVEVFEAGYAQESGPIGDCEPPYVGATHYGGNEDQQLRERNFAVFLEGGCLINFGHENWWPFGGAEFFDDGETWDTVQADDEPVQAGYAWALIDEFCANTAWAPTSSFVTTGQGSGDTKAAQGASGLAALAYFPDNRTVQVDTTILSGTGNVRLRWYDPTTGGFTSISASEAQQTGRSVTLPSARGDGTRDFVLVVDLLELTLSVDNASHGHSAGTPTLTQVHSLTVQSASHGHSAGSPSLTQTHVLTVQGATHSQTAGAPTLTQVHVLTVQGATHTQTAGTVTLDVEGDLVVQSASHGHTAASPTLTQLHVLAVDAATHGHTAESVTLTGGSSLTVQSATHTQTASAPTLGQVHILDVDDATHGHTAQTPALTQAHILVVAAAVHAHLATNITFGPYPVGAIVAAFTTTATAATFTTTTVSASFDPEAS